MGKVYVEFVNMATHKTVKGYWVSLDDLELPARYSVIEGNDGCNYTVRGVIKDVLNNQVKIECSQTNLAPTPKRG